MFSLEPKSPPATNTQPGTCSSSTTNGINWWNNLLLHSTRTTAACCGKNYTFTEKKPLVKLMEKILFNIWLSLSGKHVLNVDCNVFCDY